MSNEIPDRHNPEIQAKKPTFWYEAEPEIIRAIKMYAHELGISEGDFFAAAYDFQILRIAAREAGSLIECVDSTTQDYTPFNSLVKKYQVVFEKDDARARVGISLTQEQDQTIMLAAAYGYSGDNHVSEGCVEWDDQRTLIGRFAKQAITGYMQRLGVEDDGWQLRINGNLGSELDMYLTPIREQVDGSE